jgi:hypothetical protein
MDKYSLFVPNFLPSGEYLLAQSNKTCVGCGVSLAVRQIGKVIENFFDDVTFERPGQDDLFKGKTDVAFLKIKKGDSEVLFCLDDEPAGGVDNAVKKPMPASAVEQGVKYVATACPSYPFDLMNKVQMALKVSGKSYIHVLCPCPSGWKFNTENTVKVGFKAVESLAFPLYEVVGGTYKLTNKTVKPRQIAEYFGAQERFSNVKDNEINAANAAVQEEYKKLFGAA